ncbi:hypothetical protein MKZ38_001090 [Zalerion maritima]|uniref:SUN domain-containing protein n=1 Tax=Zalerion maritima TaxID=339359 RepID=A0AAD5RS70_9PEZI|nr:hypothetical protein MKZ38_001090 [Zalerion maritima]
MPPRRSARSQRTNPYETIPPVPLSPNTLPGLPSRVTASYGSPFAQAPARLQPIRAARQGAAESESQAEAEGQDSGSRPGSSRKPSKRSRTTSSRNNDEDNKDTGTNEGDAQKPREKRPRGRPRSASPAKKRQKQAESTPIETHDASFDNPVENSADPSPMKPVARAQKVQSSNSSSSPAVTKPGTHLKKAPGGRGRGRSGHKGGGSSGGSALEGSSSTSGLSVTATAMGPPSQPPPQKTRRQVAEEYAKNQGHRLNERQVDEGFTGNNAEPDVGSTTFNPNETLRSIEEDEVRSEFSREESIRGEDVYQANETPTNQYFPPPVQRIQDYRSYTMESSIFGEATFASDMIMPPSTASSLPNASEDMIPGEKKVWLAGAPVRAPSRSSADEFIQAVPEEQSDSDYYNTRSITRKYAPGRQEQTSQILPPCRGGSTNPFAGTPGRTPMRPRGQRIDMSSEDEATEDDALMTEDEAKRLFTKKQTMRPNLPPSRQQSLQPSPDEAVPISIAAPPAERGGTRPKKPQAASVGEPAVEPSLPGAMSSNFLSALGLTSPVAANAGHTQRWSPFAATSRFSSKAKAAVRALAYTVSQSASQVYQKTYHASAGAADFVVWGISQPAFLYFLLACFIAVIASQTLNLSMSDEDGFRREKVPSVPRGSPTNSGRGGSRISLPSMSWLASAITPWLSAFWAWLTSFGKGPRLDNDQFHTIKTELSDKIMSQLENQLPDAVHLTRDADGNIQVPTHFWQALRELIKNDEELLTLDVTTTGDAITGRHWAALAARIRESEMGGSSDVTALDVHNMIAQDVPPMWEQWIRDNQETVADILGPYFGDMPGNVDRIRESVGDFLRERGLDDVVLTREEFLSHLKQQFTAHRDKMSAELEQLRARVVKLTEQFSNMPLGVSKTEVQSIVDAEIQQLLGKEQLETLASQQIDQFWLGDLQRQVNFFSPGNGAEIGSSLASPTWNPACNLSPLGKIFEYNLFNRFRDIRPGPKKALQAFQEPEDCWCAGPNKLTSEGGVQYNGVATLPIELSRTIQPEHFVIEHIRPEKVLDPGSAPKDIEIWAYVEDPFRRRDLKDWAKFTFSTNNGPSPPPSNTGSKTSTRNLRTEPPPLENDKFVMIGRLQFSAKDIEKGHRMYSFGPAMSDLALWTDSFVVRAVTNHGSDHTCFYRVRMFGKMKHEGGRRGLRTEAGAGGNGKNVRGMSMQDKRAYPTAHAKWW